MDNKQIARILNIDLTSDNNAIKAGIKKVIDKVTTLEKEQKALKAEKETLENKVKTMKREKVTNIIDGAIKDNRISEDMKSTYIEMANDNPALTEKIINKLPKIKPVIKN